ncbi:UNVERIFIED_CONTAM: hypothetical protein GTU68_030744 [Idotea baltica]|nr:hypothetical protein [Idotea baltica]
MKNYKIFSGSSHPEFAQAICKELGVELGKTTIKNFSCGEKYIKYEESFRGQDVFLVQTGSTTHMNDDLIELFLMIDAAKQSFARKIHVVMPYFPYSRQDKIHDAREGISAKLMADLIVKAGADHVISLHLHSDQAQGFFDVPMDNLNPRKIFIDYFKKKNLSDTVVVAPEMLEEQKNGQEVLPTNWGFPACYSCISTVQDIINLRCLMLLETLKGRPQLL